MSDKLGEIKLLAHNAMATGKGHVDLTTYALTWLIEQLEQAQAANQKLLELFQQKIDTLDERIETRKGPNYFDESERIAKFHAEAYTWEQALALAKKILTDDKAKERTR